MTMTIPHLSLPETVPFERLYLDPNNPRIAPDPAPGYDDATKLFDPVVQRDLPQKVFEAYQAEDLEQAITRLGWTPIDPIIVWKHPDREDAYVVVEGNTRTAILRRARLRLAAAQARLGKARSGGRIIQDVARDQQRDLRQLQALVDATAQIQVQFVQARDANELDATLPKLLGVRHVTGTKNWGPYATNRYITLLYEDLFRKRYIDGRELKLEKDLVSEVAEIFSMTAKDARLRIQTASAFDHFKAEFAERVEAAGNEFKDRDNYYFDQILRNPYPREKLKFGADDLQLSEEASEALFQWVFSKPRAGDEDDDDNLNPNVMRKAEDMREWNALSRYDNKNSTNFAIELDVLNPANSPTLKEIKLQKDQHKARFSPVQNLNALLQALKDMKADALHQQSTMLKPVLDEIRVTSETYLRMIESDR
ncbi:hypothetical protein [Agrobacterium larrymoorei]|uniref:ParB/Sulfiredoxin domain-containing protein n=1 Tax=Agrobacterium larrymoorei TaxID=160699 RepID=A0A4D7DUW0_9HYPH|nr:hypothetical protein [Agrobacterium larrymoorei]QCJ00894.1 hypothetical protein CFBP5473_23120 [Agrobacterium larrymoorei]QYA10230.1 hypothetical protein J5285_23790 [Agrobacterium larrymoorei]